MLPLFRAFIAGLALVSSAAGTVPEVRSSQNSETALLYKYVTYSKRVSTDGGLGARQDLFNWMPPRLRDREWVWDDSGSHKAGGYSLWSVTSSCEGYIVVGGIFLQRKAGEAVAPTANETAGIMAVRKDLLDMTARIAKLWDDTGSGLTKNGVVYQTTGKEDGHIPVLIPYGKYVFTNFNDPAPTEGSRLNLNYCAESK
ncbi:hypothetical protein C8R46DRAFT_1042853 [Mycena filopes]|nr:hypothetical protein C8R46DRAFT_1042853 [Mycena filopes]